VFEASFFVGKLVLVALLLRLLLALEADGLVVASMLAALAPSSGTPELHGFYWVVPSFWPASSYAPATSPQLRRSSSLWPPRPTT
jgi:hypothetical protein